MENNIKFTTIRVYNIVETIYENEKSKTCFYKAKDMEYDRYVGIKTIKFEDQTQRNCLLREARCMVALEEVTDKIPTLYDYYYDNRNSIFTLVMQFIEGHTLRNVMKEDINRLKEPFIIRKNIELIYQLCLVLGRIHQGINKIQHKDLKPENIIVKNNGQLDQAVYVIDFGISAHPMKNLTGSKGYSAPEQIGEYNYKNSDNVDVFALGLIMFELLTGKTIKVGNDLFAGKLDKDWTSIPSLTDYNDRIPFKYNEIVKKCLQLAPNKRYRNGMEVAKALKAIMDKKEAIR